MEYPYTHERTIQGDIDECAVYSSGLEKRTYHFGSAVFRRALYFLYFPISLLPYTHSHNTHKQTCLRKKNLIYHVRAAMNVLRIKCNMNRTDVFIISVKNSLLSFFPLLPYSVLLRYSWLNDTTLSVTL